MLAKIRQNPPGLIFHADYIPGDLASFQQQFRSDPTPSLMYQQYGPSIPEYLELAGERRRRRDLVDGDRHAAGRDRAAFKDAYQEEYDAQAGLSQAGGQYDLVHVWAQRAAHGRRPDGLRGGEREPEAARSTAV